MRWLRVVCFLTHAWCKWQVLGNDPDCYIRCRIDGMIWS